MRYFCIFIFLCSGQVDARALPGLQKVWATHTAASKQALEAYHATAPLLLGQRLIYANALDGVGALNLRTGRQEWKFDVQGGVDSNLIAHQGKLFFGGRDGVFYSLNLTTGQKLWGFHLSASPSGIRHYQRVLYILTRKHVLYALQSESGQALWSANLAASQSSYNSQGLRMRSQLRPAVQGHFIIVGQGDHVYAINKQNGQIAWQKNLNPSSLHNSLGLKGGVRAVVATKGRVYVSHFELGVFCLRVSSDARILWQQKQGAASAVRLHEGQLFYAASEGGVVAVEASSGQKKWHLKDAYGLATEPELLASHLIVGRADGPVQWIDKKQGQVLSSFFTGRGVWARPRVDRAKRQAYILSSRAHMWKLSLEL